MADEFESALPTSYVKAARSAIYDAFGAAHISTIEAISGGASGAFPFRVSIQDRHYMVRVEGPASPLRNPHQYESMRIAADEGIAPRLYYVDEAARVAVMDFVEEQPLTAFPGGPRELAKAVAGLLGRVRGTRPFPRFVEYSDMVDRLWAWVCQTGLFAPGVLEPYTERFLRIREAYLWDPANSVSSHNDPVPRNFLFDGERLWLIDWESAYRNDPLVDIAITLDNFASSVELESVVLEAYSGGKSDEVSYNRLSSVRAFVRLYYAGVLLSASFAKSGALADHDLSAPTLPELKQAIHDGHLKPGTPSMTHILGKMYLASFLTGVVPPPLDERLLK